MLLSAALQMLQKVMSAIDVAPEEDRVALLTRAQSVYKAIERCEGVVNAAPSSTVSKYGQALATLLKALEEKPFENAAQLGPYADAIEKVLTNEEVLHNPEDAALLKQCIETLVRRTQEFNEDGPAPPPRQAAQNVPAAPIAMFLEQLERVAELVNSQAFIAQPAERKRVLVASALQMMEKMATAATSVPPQDRRVLEDKLRQVYAIVQRHAFDGPVPIVNAQPTNATDTSHLDVLRKLYDTLCQKQFHSMTELKPFADILQKLVTNNELLAVPEAERILEQCMIKLTQISDGFRGGPRTQQGGSELRPQTVLLIEQLGKVVTLLNAESFDDMPMERKQMVFSTAASMLDVVSKAIDEAPLADRSALMAKSQEIIAALNKWQGTEPDEEDGGDGEEETDATTDSSDGEIPTARKVEMLSRLTALMEHRSFELMEYSEQVDMMQRVISVLQMMTSHECAVNKKVVELALKAVDKVQSRLRQASDGNAASTGVVDILPRICERIMRDDFVEITSPYELECVFYVVQAGIQLVSKLGNEARGALEEILGPLQEMLQKKLPPSAQPRLGIKHANGSPDLRFGFFSPTTDSESALVWRNIVLYKEGDDLDVLPSDAQHESTVVPEVPFTPTESDVAVIYAQDSSLEIVASFLGSVLTHHGFKVLDIVGSRKPLDEILDAVADGATTEPHRLVVWSILTGVDDADYTGVLASFKAFSKKLNPDVRFLGIHDNFDSLHLMYSSQGSVDGCSVTMTPDALETSMHDAFPFSGTFTPRLLEALHSSGYQGTRTLSVEQLLNFVLSRTCPENPTNMSPRKGSHFVGRGLCEPYFGKN
jgi:hypothetical protein